jgi:sodium/pantothenate symporter
MFNSPPILAVQGIDWGPATALLLVLGFSAWLGIRAQKQIERKSFMTGYFLGNRGLGAWILALTATVQSGGTFMGFPSLVYSYGWIVALLIASYMVVALANFGIIGKRLAQLSRSTGAITVPDLFRARFDSPAAGLVCSLLVILFMGFLMIAQFKAGAILIKHALSLGQLSGPTGIGSADWRYLLGLAIFTIGVVGYTIRGGFLASAWTDFFQSILMLVGVLILLGLVIPLAGGLEQATRGAVQNTSLDFAFGPGYSPDGRQFLPVSLAVSFFFIWIFGGMGGPATMVRMMATKSTKDIRRGMFVLSVYNLLIYVPLILICICGRAIIPNLKDTDEIIPQLAMRATENLSGGSLISGLIIAAPFGAVLATVSTYLVIIASGIVRDVYYRFIRPGATDTELRTATFTVMIGLGLLGLVSNINPVSYLQAFIVFSSTGQAASFVAPALMLCFWRRATAAGAIASMLAGGLTVLGLLIAGSLTSDPMMGAATKFRSYYLFGLDPVIWGMTASALAGVIVSLMTRAPKSELVASTLAQTFLSAGSQDIPVLLRFRSAAVSGGPAAAGAKSRRPKNPESRPLYQLG